jgi:hypothetical protein
VDGLTLMSAAVYIKGDTAHGDGGTMLKGEKAVSLVEVIW